MRKVRVNEKFFYFHELFKMTYHVNNITVDKIKAVVEDDDGYLKMVDMDDIQFIAPPWVKETQR